MNLYKSIIGSLLMTAFVSSCSTDDLGGSSKDDGNVSALITAGCSNTESRVADASWDALDKIGIAMMDANGKNVLNNYKNNCYYTADGTSKFDPSSASEIIYFPVDGSSVSFKSYYPYSAKAQENNLVLPVDLSDQTSLVELDVMTATHLEGTSKDDPNVKLHFYHRLSKVIVDLSVEDKAIDLTDCKMVVDGLKTTGSYDVMSETLHINSNSTKQVAIPIHGNSGKAIFMPREAGDGVTFKVTTKSGGVYTAKLKSDVKFDGGYKYTLHILLKKTPAEVSATVEPWIDGPEISTEVIRVVTGLKDTEGFKTNDKLNLFLKDQADFAKAGEFTYNAETGKWSTSIPIYWEDIKADPAAFKGSSVITTKLNDTQMDDILLSDAIDVDQYTGVNLVMKHAGAKATVTLKSSDNTFSSSDLQGATIVFPGYKYTGSINEKGEFVIGDGTKDILAKDGVAIFPPQSIKPGDVIAKVTVNGRDYEIKATADSFDFETGVAKNITLDMKKAAVEVSTKVTEWTQETIEFNDVRIGTSTLKNNEGDLKDGDILHLYTNDGTTTTEQASYKYNAAADTWTNVNTGDVLYWEDMPKTGNIYSSIERPAVSANASDNQLADFIISSPIANDGGVSNTALNFEFKHQVAKVIVQLKSSDGSYSDTELKTATVTLPDYTIGAKMVNGVFVAGTSKGAINLPNIATGLTDSSFLQAQTIAKGNTVVKVDLNGRTYNGTKTYDVVYENGKVTTLIVDLKKSAVSVSTDVTPWSDGATETLEHMFFTTTTGTATGLSSGDKLSLVKVDNSNNATTVSNTGTVKDNGTIETDNTWYRDDFATGDKLFAASPNVAVTAGSATFDYTVDGSNSTQKDLLTAVTTVGDGTNVKFDFEHAMSKVTVNIIAGEGFTNTELQGSNLALALNNFILSGTVNVSDGKATASRTANGSFTPTKLGTANTDIDIEGIKYNAALSYESIVYPQSIVANTKLATITLNGLTYDVKFSVPKDFVEGKNTVINVTLKKTGLSFTTSVKAWEPGDKGSVTID